MKVLVTGGTGFTGSHLVKRLNREGHQVRCLVRPTANTQEIIKYNPEIVYGDMTDRQSVFDAVEGTDWVFNVAAAYRKANLTQKDFQEVNFEGTRNVLEACMEHKVKKLIHCSTIGVVTSVKNPPADENTAICPGDAYQTSKCDAEFEVLKYAKEKDLAATVIRPCAIYGPGDWRLLKMFKMIAKKRFIFFGNGKAYFHMVYIDNLMDGFMLAAQKKESTGEVFIIGDEHYITLNKLSALIAEEFGVPAPKIHLPYRFFELLAAAVEFIYKKLKIKKEPPIYKRRMAFFKKSRAFSIQKAKRILGYSPAVDIKTGIHLTALWYVDKGLIG